jgi:hypothetical protein
VKRKGADGHSRREGAGGAFVSLVICSTLRLFMLISQPFFRFLPLLHTGEHTAKQTNCVPAPL